MMRFLSLFAAIFFISVPVSAIATPWQSNKHGQVRLVSPYSVAPATGTILFGLEFKTIPNWHVYWRDPGDAGYPPKLDWTGSEGFREAVLLYPKPHRYNLPGGVLAIGYEDHVIYPIAAARTRGSIRARLTLNYMTCGNICVPYKYKLTLDLPAKGAGRLDPVVAPELSNYLNQVPANERGNLSLGTPSPSLPLPGEGGESQPLPRPQQGEAERSSGGGVLLIALFGFLGGLILNVMPCVLPVLSIKLLGLLQHGGRSRRVVTRDSLASAGGILFSFWALAALAIGAKVGGRAAGWGIQFQEPVFVASLAIVMLLFALNLWGLFEIHLPTSIAHLGAITQDDEGPLGYFTSGLFATLMATPCSAPFLGTALGFALAQGPAVIFLIFTTVGLGMAFPYLLLATFPGSLTWLPRPGAWMLRVRTFLGFLLAATVVWLGYILANQVSTAGLAWFGLALVIVSGLVWLRGSFGDRDLLSPSRNRVLLVLAFLVAVSGLLAIHHAKASYTQSADKSAIAWVPFDEARIQNEWAQGRTVFVDVTADWCFTCKVNERVVLSDPEIVQAFEQKGIVMMQADWTNQNEEIADYLKKFGRAGIPFYALYRPGKKPYVYSELLTKSAVLRSLE